MILLKSDSNLIREIEIREIRCAMLLYYDMLGDVVIWKHCLSLVYIYIYY